jgi:hypothetical protein
MYFAYFPSTKRVLLCLTFNYDHAHRQLYTTGCWDVYARRKYVLDIIKPGSFSRGGFDYNCCFANCGRKSQHTAKKSPFMYSFSGNCTASVPISTLMCLGAIYTYIPRIGPPISCSRIGRPILGDRSL